MQPIAYARILSVVILGASTYGSAAAPTTSLSSDHVEAQHPRILVGFSNVSEHPPGPAGTTARRYNGGGYLITQSAHRAAQRVAARYSLRLIASWPIEALGVDCVVYEIPDARPVSDLLSALASDSHIAFAQPLQQFRTLTADYVSRWEL